MTMSTLPYTVYYYGIHACVYNFYALTADSSQELLKKYFFVYAACYFYTIMHTCLGQQRTA